MQSFFEHDPGRIDIQHTDLRREDQITVIGDIVSGRTQTVTVKHGSYHISVAEQDRCRSVPRLHHRCMILIKIFFALAHGLVVCPWFRDRDHHGQRQIHTTHHHKFQCVVEHCRVRTGSIDNRQNFVQLSFEMLGEHRLFACKHLVGISTDRVDLTVVYDKAVRMCSLPARICVGTETRVYDRDRRFIICILQITEEGTELSYEEHTFVYDRSA